MSAVITSFSVSGDGIKEKKRQLQFELKTFTSKWYHIGSKTDINVCTCLIYILYKIIYLFIYLSIYLYIYLSIYLYIHLGIFLTFVCSNKSSVKVVFTARTCGQYGQIKVISLGQTFTSFLSALKKYLWKWLFRVYPHLNMFCNKMKTQRKGLFV